MKISENEVRKIFSNPMYCLPKVEGWEVATGEAIVSKDIWKEGAKKIIKEIGIDQWLDDLLSNLESKYD